MDKQANGTIEYYAAIKRNEVLIQTTTSINLRIITASERIQTKRSTCYMIPFIVKSRKCKLIFSDRKQSKRLFAGAGRAGSPRRGIGNFGRVDFFQYLDRAYGCFIWPVFCTSIYSLLHGNDTSIKPFEF